MDLDGGAVGYGIRMATPDPLAPASGASFFEPPSNLVHETNKVAVVDGNGKG